MDKQFFFLAGLPRSGSTLLAGLLAQNPAIHVSGTSGILSIITNIRNHWSDVAEFNALEPATSEARKLSVLKGAFNGFYTDVEKPVIIDKCRGWPQHLEMAETMLGYKPKVIVTVRDVRDVLASFEKLWRIRKANNQLVDLEKSNPIDFQSLESRCRLLMSGVVGSSITVIVDAVTRGWKSSMLFVEYDDLCCEPLKVLGLIYEFLAINQYKYHDVENVSSSAYENDTPYGWGELHSVRPNILPQEQQWPKYLTTAVAMQYSNDAKFWRSL